MQLHSTFTCRATAPSNVHTECFEVVLIQPLNIESCDLSIVSSVVTCPRLSRGNIVIIMATFRGNNQICGKGLSPISHSLRSLILLTGEMFDPSELVFSSYIYTCSLYWSHPMQFQCILCNYQAPEHNNNIFFFSLCLTAEIPFHSSRKSSTTSTS